MKFSPRNLVAISLAFAHCTWAEGLLFNRDVRPILSDKCFACHGFDSKTREAGLRLDSAEGAFQKNKEGQSAVVPGKPEESLLWQRINTKDEDDVMPPPKSHKAISHAEREILRQWITQGAAYQKHWAFEAPAVAAADASADVGIDHFIAKTLAQRGQKLATEADKPTLIRRVSMALTGLPPSLADVDTFLADSSADAVGHMVDRFLDSKQFGEEMARHWLDVARYGDTHGMHLDNERQTWAYRDWVVNAFNRNLPYDQFTIDQLAGDLIPGASQDQIVATGFNRCNVTTGEGGSIDAEYIYRYAVDRAGTTAQAWLGLTAGCAVCHDHKYDPISTKEFYSLYAFFHSSADPAMDGNALLTAPVAKVTSPDYKEKQATYEKDLAEVQKEMDTQSATVVYTDPATLAAPPPPSETETVWFDDDFPAGANVTASGPATAYSTTPAHVKSGKRSLKRVAPDVGQDYYDTGAASMAVPDKARIFLHVFLSETNPPKEVMIQFNKGGWSHRALWGEDSIEFGAKGTTQRYVAGPLPPVGQWIRLEVPVEKIGLAAGDMVNGYAFTVKGGTVYFDLMGVAGLSDPVKDPQQSFAAWRNHAKGKDTPGTPAGINAMLKAGPEAARTAEEMAQLQKFYIQSVCTTTQKAFSATLEKRKAVQKTWDDYLAMQPSTFVWKDLPQPRDSFVMVRGQYDKPGEKVTPGTPAVLPPLKKAAERATRLDLAKWLVSSENPLTARVAVNRLWQQMFGIGLVKTSHDFGTQGETPSHLELLDWLSIWFQKNQWDVKKLCRLMLTSAAFRQQSSGQADHWLKDPDNRYLARGPRFRLDAEQLRDQALFVSGMLDLKMGGVGVKPYQPPNIWEPVGFGGSNTRFYKQDTGSALYRRSLYTFFKRTAPHPLMANFDAPNREQSCVRRERSNTPLQALQLMNDVQHWEAARGFATRLMTVVATPADRVTMAFRSVLARPPTAEELAVVTEFFATQHAKYKTKPEEAKKAISFGETPPQAGLEAPELAAWTLVANLILNMDEAIVRN